MKNKTTVFTLIISTIITFNLCHANENEKFDDSTWAGSMEYKGFDKDGYDINGYDQEGFNRDGYNKEGYDRVGNHIEVKKTATVKELKSLN